MSILGPLVQVDREKCLSWKVDQAPCEEACPLGIKVEDYVNAVGKGDFTGALAVVLQECPLPGVLGRICYRPCEVACKRHKVDEAIAIRELKRYAGDYGRIEMARPQPQRRPGSQKVAIIGSGPAGLTCAYHLALRGYRPAIFEALPVVGGMLSVGIPEYRLPKKVLAADLQNITELGVKIKTNAPVEDKADLDRLFQEGYQAVFMAIGAHQGKNLNIPGEKSDVVIQGVTFLRDLNLGKKVRLGKRVAVIGGGNVALDAARSALRLRSDVTVFYRRTKNEMPASGEDIKAIEDEGINIEYLSQPVKILGGNGKATILEFARTGLVAPDASGRRQPVIVPDSESKLEMDTIIVCVGQTPPSTLAKKMKGMRTSGSETIEVDPRTLATSLKGVFAGGDAQSGPSTAVEAMAAGKKAAISIDRYLNGEEAAKNGEDQTPPIVTGAERIPRNVIPRRSQKPFEVSPAMRIQDFSEVNLGYTKNQALFEAGNCLKCRTCNRCLEQFGCPAIVWRQNDAKFSPEIDRDLCIGCQVCPQVCPFSSIQPLETQK
jgi:NADPH-dependent glutamate synthase beta subunit-like oxidoreductase